ncbi:hypothetical protein PPERSA_06161 [Pseudocohnilembus persalinus]|uniref:Peptidase C13, legumain n=1 Tax=Pseudocohnilembus persalinus TaxID=266149 RepID=A0A0V0QEB8_PSEPJ|nr:hypothetical protein PPERSA_06161 [Pseudocohnilembus persalinus]|eukprot:KRX00518.1 hypothetical protein PPERSA_06161 [Pseudocohnilembus persalinus]
MMIYQTLRNYGFNDENILLLIPENTSCNPRNPVPGQVSPYDNKYEPNLFRNIEVDYKHSDVEVKSFFNILRGRYNKYLPQGQRIRLHKNANILVYFTGHGGDSYIKMQDTDVVFDEDLERILRESYTKELYHEIAMFSDSCSAATLFYKLVAPNIFSVGSSTFDEKSYSYGRDSLYQQSKTDRFTYNNYQFLNNEFKANRDLKFADLFKTYTYDFLKSHYETINTMPNRNEKDIYLKEFWTNQRIQKIKKQNFQKLQTRSQYFNGEIQQDNSNENDYLINTLMDKDDEQYNLISKLTQQLNQQQINIDQNIDIQLINQKK